MFYLKKKGYRKSTLEGYSDVFKHLARNVDIDDVEEVKAFISNKQVSEARKQVLVDRYAQYCTWRNVPFTKPIYKAVKRLPFIPTEKELDALISASGKKTSTFLQALKETGARPGEAWALKWTDVDFDRKVVCINDPEKNSLPRTFKVSNKLTAMLHSLRKKCEFIFRETPESRLRKFTRNFYKKRITLSEKLQNPRIRKINLKTFRHWKATIEYHKTKDILHACMHSMSLEENKAIVRKMIEEYNKANFDILDDLVASDYIGRFTGPPHQLQGLESLKQLFIMGREGCPDWHETIEDIIAEGDKVWVRTTYTGTNTGEFFGLAPTGKKITTYAVDIYRIVNGKIVEGWSLSDRSLILKQLGIIEYTEKGKKLFPENAT